MKFNSHDIYRLIGLIAGLGGSEVIALVTPILNDFGVGTPLQTRIASAVLGVIGVAALVNTVWSKLVPDGWNTVITRTTTPVVLSTKDEVTAPHLEPGAATSVLVSTPTIGGQQP